MKNWSILRVLAIAIGYVLAALLSTMAWARWTRAIEVRPSGQWKFFWLVPYSTARNYLLVLFVPPFLLLLFWLAVRLFGWVRAS
jgi:hypothetical protein